MDAYKNLVQALQYLSSVCDGAQEQDGAGFNGVDSPFGKSLAEQSYSRQLSDGQIAAAVKMLQKYRGQCAGAGIELPHESDFQIATETRIEQDGNSLLVYAPASPKDAFWATVNSVKTIPGRKWEPNIEGKPWRVPGNQVAMLRELFPDVAFDFETADLPEPEPVKIQPSTISKNGNGYQVRFAKDDPSFSSKLDAIRNLPNRKWIADGGYWLVADIFGIETLLKMHSYELDEATKQDLQAHKTVANRSERPDDFNVPGVHGEPFPFQLDGVYLADKANGRLIIGDDMGLGKTLQSLMYLQLHPELRPAVIVVPASVKTHWKRQYRQWLKNNDRIEVLEGQKAKLLPTADVYIINYDILKFWLPLLKQVNPKVAIADEAHMLKSVSAQRTKAFDTLAKQCEAVLLLTGTAVQNRPAELWKLLNLVAPKAWPKWFDFAHRYCDPKKQPVRYRDKTTKRMVNREIWDFSGASNLPELHERIKPYFIRRMKKDVLNLGEKTRITVTLDVPDSKLQAYNAAMRDAMAKLVEDGKEDSAQLVMFEKAKQAAFEAKFDAAVEWISNLLDSGRKLVLFATHKDAARRLTAAFADVAVTITGETSQKARNLAVDRFQNDDKCRLLVGNIQAAGVGLTLTAASDVAFVEFDWTPANHQQAEDRVYRIGQDAEAVQAWYLVLPDTIEETIVQLLYQKSMIVSAVLDGTTDKLENASIFGEFLNILKRGEHANN
jgi:SWI/SNF-related matrix-associated actin-dependent regulator 1 of chromatin subfamily A